MLGLGPALVADGDEGMQEILDSMRREEESSGGDEEPDEPEFK